MTRIKLPTTKRECMHDANNRHPTWRATDGDWGVCMMAPLHIERCIRMLIKNIRDLEDGDAMAGFDDWPWPQTEMTYIATDHLEMLLTERNRRIKAGKWKSVT